ncbi:Uncharacterized protein Fot_19355 [Forsythia ovata]|uniref:Cytochrome P450 n=1 Tax=Forsythia ovata TaxID=205694 RepID=A0ABD1VKT5_9LAMI
MMRRLKLCLECHNYGWKTYSLISINFVEKDLRGAWYIQYVAEEIKRLFNDSHHEYCNVKTWTQQTVGPDSRHVGPTIDFWHSIHMAPSLEASLPAGPSHLSTAPSYISSLLPTPILSVSQSLDVSRPVDPSIVPSSHVGPATDLLQTSAFAYDYSLHDRLLTIAGPTGSLPLAVDHYAESRSVIDPVYGSSLHDRPAISVGPTSTLAHSEFFDPLLDHMIAAPRAGVCLDDTIDSNPDTSPLLDCRDNTSSKPGPLRQEKLQNLCDYVHECSVNHKLVDIGKAAFIASLNLMSATLFSGDGAQYNSDSTQELKETIVGMAKILATPNFADFFPVLKSIDPQRIKHESKRYFGKAYSILENMINQRLKLSAESLDSVVKNDFLQALLDYSRNNSSEYPSDHIKHLLLDLFAGGTEAAATTVVWIMTELIRNP